MHILVAEDDTFLQSVYGDALTKAGYTVTTVGDGAEAMELMRRKKPDLLLLDVLMPKKDGFAVLKEKVADPSLAAIPVIMLTSLDQEADMEEAMRLGAANYFLKNNMDIDELATLVMQILPAHA